FDPVPAKGSFKWVPVRFYPDFAACYGHLSKLGYTLFVLDPAQGESLPKADLPCLSAFVLGHEEYGISFKREDFPRVRGLTIPQFGRVQSLNVSIAASIVIYEYIRRHGRHAEQG
ncbi:MAG: TrmH family RNA methyltransferase, partial [Candidatus Competibacteraceae bacterium]|nr:TrmH family RNA methyltransferase [Candidatus Competibacteraceae bacterium]